MRELQQTIVNWVILTTCLASSLASILAVMGALPPMTFVIHGVIMFIGSLWVVGLVINDLMH